MKFCENRLKIARRLLILFMAIALCVCTYTPVSVLAAQSQAENSICTVIVNSKMRSTPSKSGSQVTSVPDGAFVVVLEKEGDYFKVQYGEYEGYIYRGCVSLSKTHSYDEYVAQFPGIELVEEKSSGINTVMAEKKLQMSDLDAQTNKRNERTSAILEKQREAFIVAEKNAADEDIENVNAIDDKDDLQDVVLEAKVYAKVKLRSLPTTESKQIASVPTGDIVEIIDDGENGFMHVYYNGMEGYVYERCIDHSTIKKEADAVADNSKDNKAVEEHKVVATSDLVAKAQAANVREERALEINESSAYEIRTRANMRLLPTSDSDKLTTLPIGADITLLGQSSGGYTLVQYNGITGYVLENCVVDASEVSMVGKEPVLFTLTGYCSCSKCCGSYSPEVRGGEAHTATGTVPAEGRTIAVDPSLIPYGSRVVIDGLGTFVAEDCGGSVNGAHIDVYFEEHESAKAFGVKKLYVTLE